MIDRVVEIATPARLSVRHAQLVIDRPEQAQAILPFTTPLAEIAVLLLAHPQINLSQAVLTGLAECGGAVVTIDGNYLPASMMLPIQMHSLQTERLAAQAQLALPLRKRLWQAIVRAKIRAQGDLLQEIHGSDGGLRAMALRVASGDPKNLEAQAARRYWSLLFPRAQRFRRGSGEQDANRHLDYGYTVLRAAAGRALCAVGLHPSMGVHHRNRYDPFSLAADLMEPFRPLVDRRVLQWLASHEANGAFEREAKAWMIGAVISRYQYEREDRTLFDIMLRAANKLAACMTGEAKSLDLPAVLLSSVT
jgi:CRISPR-associated protein Cas1